MIRSKIAAGGSVVSGMTEGGGSLSSYLFDVLLKPWLWRVIKPETGEPRNADDLASAAAAIGAEP